MPSASADLAQERPHGLVTRSGNSCRPSRATASQSSVTALSSLIIEPWPARPVAVSRIQAMPFSAVSIEVEPQVVRDRQREAADLADRLGAALEQLRVVVDQPVRAVAAAGLLVGEEGEHDVAAGRRPVRIRSRTTASIIASMSFMSTAPRPQT